MSSDFMRLPPEVRNLVYEYLLVSPGPILITDDGLDMGGGISGPSILGTNKAIHSEAVLILYSKNSFKLPDIGGYSHPGALVEFAGFIGHRNATLIRRLCIAFPQFTPQPALRPDPEVLVTVHQHLKGIKILETSVMSGLAVEDYMSQFDNTDPTPLVRDLSPTDTLDGPTTAVSMLLRKVDRLFKSIVSLEEVIVQLPKRVRCAVARESMGKLGWKIKIED